MSQSADVDPEGRPDVSCCSRAEQMWMMDDIILSARDGQPLPTEAIDQLPPWRARMVVGLLLRDGAATLQHGTPELFEQAAVKAGREDARQRGWWRRALELPSLPDAPDAPPAPGWGDPGYVPPAGFTLVRPTGR